MSVLDEKYHMHFDPATGRPNPTPVFPSAYRAQHGKIAWLYNPYTGHPRDPRDIGTDTFGHLIVSAPRPDSEACRAYSREEVLETFLGALHVLAANASVSPTLQPPRQMCDNLVFSILNMIDGTSGLFPVALDLVLRPHHENQSLAIEEGENWYQDGMVINPESEYLHDNYYRKG